MNNDSIKVVVDYMRGNYIVYGLYNGTIQPLVKPIRGIDRDGLFKDNYSTRMIKNRKQQIKRLIKEIEKEDPEFKYSEKAIKQVDSVMFKLLESWDQMSGTKYAINYLKTIIQDFRGMENQKQSNKIFDEKCAQIRKEQLDELGIDISYNTALFNTDRSLTFLDKIRGIIIAKKQKECIDAKVNNSLILEEDYFEKDIDQFIKSLKEKVKDRTKKENREKPYIILNKERRMSKFESIKKSPISTLKFDKVENRGKKPDFAIQDKKETKAKFCNRR